MRPGSRAPHIHRLAPPRRPTPLAGRKQWPLSWSRPASDPCRLRTSYMSASVSSPRDSISHDDHSDQVHGKKNRAQLDVYVSDAKRQSAPGLVYLEGVRRQRPSCGSRPFGCSFSLPRPSGVCAFRSGRDARVAFRAVRLPRPSASGHPRRFGTPEPAGRVRHSGGTGRPCSRKNESLSQ